MLRHLKKDVAGFGEMSISYLKDNLGISHFGVLSPNDAYGQGFQQVRYYYYYYYCYYTPLFVLLFTNDFSFWVLLYFSIVLDTFTSFICNMNDKSVLEAAAGYGGMTGVSAQYLPTLTSKDEIDANIRLALKLLKQSGFK